jgi:hypothetical protein
MSPKTSAEMILISIAVLILGALCAAYGGW